MYFLREGDISLFQDLFFFSLLIFACLGKVVRFTYIKQEGARPMVVDHCDTI